MSTSYDGAPGRLPSPDGPASHDPPAAAPSRGAYAEDPGRRPGRPRFDGWLGRPAPSTDEQGSPRPRRRRLVLAAAAAGVGVLAAAALAVAGGDEAQGGYTFGTVATAAGALVRTSEDAAARPLVDGEAVLAGWVLEAAGDSGAVELEGGGVLRFDRGARLAFRDAGGGTGGRRPRPAIAVRAGRAWLNPGGDTASTGVVLTTGSLTVATSGNPVGVDCTSACSVEVPAGGVEVEGGDVVVRPAAGEVVVDGDEVVVRASGAPSEWALANLADDDGAGLPAPRPRDGDGVAADALPATFYALDLTVTGPGEGGDLGAGITWHPGEQLTLDASVDTPACPALPCSTRISSFDRVERGTGPDRAGLLRVGDGRLAVSLDRQIGCPDASTGGVGRVVGASTLTADLAVTESTYDRSTGRWTATALAGTGTVAVTVTDASCATASYATGTLTLPLQVAGTAT